MNSADVESRFACEDLMHRSYQLIDDGQAGQVTDLFTDDGQFSIKGSREVSGREALAKVFAARQMDTERQTQHCLTNLVFSSQSANTARIRATLVLFVLNTDTPTMPAALADVEDRYLLIDGTWRIRSRITTPIAGGG